MNDLFRFLALAVALGLAAGMVLGGIALLLAAPAYGTEGRPVYERASSCDGDRYAPRIPTIVDPPRTPARAIRTSASRSS